jgi:hypothetical protein
MTARTNIKLLIAFLVVALVPFALYVRVDSKDFQAAATVQAAGRGGPYFNLQNGHEMRVEYRGEQNLTAAMQSGQARARSLAAMDLNGDAAPDVVAGYAYGGLGIVTVQRGNTDAFAPKDDGVFVRMQQGYNPDSLLPLAETFLIPEAADFLQVGDFNHDSRKDVLVAASGGDLFLLAGDGNGGLGAPEQIALPGQVTALSSGEFRAADGAPDVAVSVSGPEGSSLLIYDGARGFSAEPLTWQLAGPASAIQFADLDSDPFADVAVSSGSQVKIVHGWGRKLEVDPQSQVENIDAAANVRGLALGYFLWNRSAAKQIGVLGDDGSLQLLQRGALDTRPYTTEDLAALAKLRREQKKSSVDVETVAGWQAGGTESWTTAREVASVSAPGAVAAAPALMTRSHISFRETDDLLVLGGSEPKVNIVRQVGAQDSAQVESLTRSADLVEMNLDVADAPVAVLALPQKLNGERSLVVLQSGSSQPTIVPQAPTAIIAVDRTDDTAAASACTGAANDCSLRGAVAFANANAGSTINIPAGTYALSINGTGGCLQGAETNSIGDLEINQSTTIAGAGAATTIIRQLGTGNGGTFTGDRVMCLNVTFLVGLVDNFSAITITGGRDTTGGGTTFGGGGIIGGEKDNQLNLTNVVVSNNQNTGPGLGGGGIQITGGSMTIVGSTIGGTNDPGANRSDATLGNSVGVSGGGISYSPGSPTGKTPSTGTMNVSTSTFSHNFASSTAAGGGGLDLYTHNLATGSVSIATSTFNNNKANGAPNAGSGGAINIESIGTTVATSNITANTATNLGGGIFVGGGSLLLDGTSAGITFTSNTATNGGSSVGANSTVNVAGTNTSIGGTVAVFTNGTWTNNTGSTLAPTDFSVLGGVLNCNNSTMNISGNFVIGHEATKGGIFNGNTSTINIQGNMNVDLNNGGSGAVGQFNAGTGSFTFNGSAAQSITNISAFTFNNLTDSNVTQPLTANNSFAVNGILNINGANAIFAPVAGATISGTGSLTGTGTVRVTRTGLDAFFGQYSMPTRTLTNLTVEYIGAAAQTASVTTYNVLKINNASGVSLGAGTTTVNNSLLLTAGPLAVGTSTLVINSAVTVGSGSITSAATGTVNYNQGSAGQVVIAANYGNLTFSAFTKVLPSIGTVGIAGTFTTNGITTGHTITGSTIDFNGTGAQTVPTFDFNNLTISGARGANSVTLVNGSTIKVAGVFSPTATFAGGNYVVTGNTFEYNGGGAQTIAPFNYNNLIISGSRGGAAITFGAGNVGIAGTFNPSVTNNTFVVTGNTVTFNGAAIQTIPAFTFNGLTINNATGVNLGGDVTVGGALTLTAGALGVGTNTLTLNGSASATAGSLTSAATGTVNYTQGSNGQATVLAANYGNLTFSNFSKTLASSGTIGIAGTFTPGSGVGHTVTGSTINFNGAGAQTIPGFTYNNLTSSGGVVARTLDPVNTIRIAGVFTPGTNVYTITGSTVEYNGAAAQTLPSTFTTYNNLTLNNPTTTAGFAGLIVGALLEAKAGTFTANASTLNNVQIDTGATLAGTSATTMTVSGSWTNNGGSFTANGNTVNFNGAAAQTIGGTGTTAFNNLTNSNANGIGMTNDNTVNGVLALTSSDITVAATKTLTQPAGGSSTGTFDVNGRVQRTGLVAAACVTAPCVNTRSFGNPNNQLTVTAGTAPASVVVDLARTVPGGAIGYPTAVQRTYTITPSAAGFTGTLRLHYLLSEVNGNDPALMNLWRYDATLPVPGWRPNPATSRDCAAGCTTNTSTYWAEKTGITTFSPWTLNSTNAPTASAGVITGRIVDNNGNPVAGAVVRLNGSQNRKFITDANGFYRFENVETSGFYTVTPTRANYTFNPASQSFTQLGETTSAAFGATLASSSFVNPLDTPEYFVRQHYLDFLGREPDESGFNFWSDQIIECGTDQGCIARRRENVSAAYFLSIEFQQTGGLVDGLYRIGYGVRPDFGQFMPDTHSVAQGVVVGQPGWEAKLAANKDAFVAAFVNRPAFHAAYDSLDNSLFVDTLVEHTGVSFTSAERESLVARLTAGGTRAEVVRSIAENERFAALKFNEAFVMMEYFGYLRRDPDASGFAFWLDKLNNFGGNFEQADMVKAFIVSGEFRDRFPR